MTNPIMNQPNKLQITRIVEDYNIFFNYDDKNYLLHLCRDGYEEYIMLYERNVSEKGTWELKEIDGKFASSWQFKELIRPIQKGKTIVYKFIDKEHFIKKFNEVFKYET